MKSILRVFFCFVITTHVFGQTVNPLAVSQENLILQEKWVDSIYQSLSLDEKIGQLFMPMVFSKKDSSHYRATLKLIKKWFFLWGYNSCKCYEILGFFRPKIFDIKDLWFSWFCIIFRAILGFVLLKITV